MSYCALQDKFVQTITEYDTLLFFIHYELLVLRNHIFVNALASYNNYMS